jgi:hypothetical protein
MVDGGGSVVVVKVLVAGRLARGALTAPDLVADHLVERLRDQGHEVEQLRLPFSDRDWHTIPAQMVAMRNFDIESVERLIALDFPAYLLRHAHKAVWLSERFLTSDDLFDDESAQVPATSVGAQYRALRSAADSEGLGEAESRFSVSTAVRDRLREGSGIPSDLLPVPTADPESASLAASWKDTIARLLA